MFQQVFQTGFKCSSKKAGPMKAMTQAEFARFTGVNRSTVHRWLQNGRIQSDALGLIDPDAANRMREATASPLPMHLARKAQFDDARAQATTESSTAAATPAPDAPPRAFSATVDATGATDPQNAATARFSPPGGAEPMPPAEKLGIALKLETYKLQKAKAEQANIEIDKLIGTLAERAEFDYLITDFGNVLRDKLETLPDRLASQLAALKGDTATLHAALADAMRDVLADLAEHMQRKTK